MHWNLWFHLLWLGCSSCARSGPSCLIQHRTGSFTASTQVRQPNGREVWAPDSAEAGTHPVRCRGPTLCGFAACYCALLLTGAHLRNTIPATSVTLAALWLLHYFHRGLVHPLLMRYRAASVPVLITVAGLFPNSLFSWLNAATIACLEPSISQTWHTDPRFGIGVAIYILGFVINRTSDWTLRSLRSDQQSTVYHIPHGGLFTYVSCANYFGELVQWAGWALAWWSWSGLLWWLFALSTFIPRARQTHTWYRSTFPEYPSQRRALIPFIW